MPWWCTTFKKQVKPFSLPFPFISSLFQRFGDGYTILIRTSIDSDTKTVTDYIKERIPEATIKEEHNKMIHFRVSTNVPLHHMFSVLEQARDDLFNLIEDYTVTQVTLDDVFVNFARIQQENQSTTELTEEKWWKQTFIYKLFHRKKRNLIGK